MPRLARVRFVSIGHPQARMDDLVLDLTDADGEPTDSTLWLRNGGGKSSILNLFFALPRPHRSEFLGGKAEARQRSIEDYVLPGDRSVVVAEWCLDPAADTLGLEEDRFLTGTFYERRDGSGDLRRLFFSTRVDGRHPESTLAGVPLFAGNGTRTRRTLTAFREAWRGLRDRAPYLGVTDTENQREWQEILDAARIDPELFSYQVRMNQREGGADELFRFAEPDDFIDFLLQLALDPELGIRVGRNIAAWRRELVDRKEKLLPEIELVTGLVKRMEVLDGIRTRRGDLHHRLGDLASDVERLGTWIDRRGDELTTERGEFEAERDGAIVEEERQRATAAAAERRAAGLRRHAARVRLDDLRTAHAAAQEAWREADRVRKVWAAAHPLHRARRFEAVARDHRRMLEERQSRHAPLRAELVEVAGRLAGALDVRAADARRRMEEARSAAVRLREEAADARDQAREADVLRTRAEARAGELDARLAEVDRRLQDLVANDLVGDDEHPEATLARWTAATDEATAELARLDESMRGVDEALAALADATTNAADAVRELRTRREVLDTTWDEASRAREALESDPVLLTALELETVDVDRLDATAAETLESAGRGAERRIVDTRLTIAEDERRQHHLEEHGLLPPSPDAERVVGFLEERLGGRAWTGWTWIAANVPTEHAREVVRRAPSLAQGVVVRPDDLDRAVELLERAGVEPEGLLHLTDTDALDGFPALPGTILGPGETAWFDRDAARERGREIRARLEEEARHLADAETRHRELVRVRERLRSFRDRYPEGWFARTDAGRRDLARMEADAELRLDELRSQARARAEERRAIETRRRETEVARGTAREAAARVRAFVEEHHRPAAAWREELATAHEEIGRRTKEIEAWDEMARAAEGRAESASEDVRSHGEDARSIEDERRRLTYVEGDAPAVAGPVDELRERHRHLALRYERDVGGDALLLLAQENEARAGEERVRLQGLLGADLTEHDVSEHLDRLDDPGRIEALHAEAETEASSLLGRMGNLKGRIDPAVEALGRAEERCREVDAGDPERAPSTAELADAEAATAEAAARTSAEIARNAARHAQELDERVRVLARRLHDLDRHRDRLEELRGDHGDLLALAVRREDDPRSGSAPDDGAQPTSPGASDDAGAGAAEDRSSLTEASLGDRVVELSNGLRTCRTTARSLDEERGRATTNIRSFATSRSFQALEAPWPGRLQEHDEPALERASNRLVQQLETRRGILESQVAEVDRHRDVLVDELLVVADEGLKLLRQASSLSRLPDHLPGIGGAQFLRITTAGPDDPEERRARLALLVDELAGGGRDLGGVALVQAAVRRVGRPFQVRVLHPDPALDRRAVSIPEMARASGGEQLTGAILLYCTLARVRGRARGRSRRASSVLLLDNPIGRASRARFLELQRDVARAMGVQLVYTTGVNDHEALRALPNILRLRNERIDRTTGRRLVESDGGSDGEDAAANGHHGHRVIDGVRVGRREKPDADVSARTDGSADDFARADRNPDDPHHRVDAPHDRA